MFVGNVARSADENDNGGLARREIPFHFPDVVADADKDTALTEKIRAELPVIIRRLLARFPEANMSAPFIGWLMCQGRLRGQALALGGV
jgi:Predicted ATPase